MLWGCRRQGSGKRLGGLISHISLNSPISRSCRIEVAERGASCLPGGIRLAGRDARAPLRAGVKTKIGALLRAPIWNNLAMSYFPTGTARSIIGAMELNCRVRNGNGWVL